MTEALLQVMGGEVAGDRTPRQSGDRTPRSRRFA
jgi:hypothetical protein